MGFNNFDVVLNDFEKALNWFGWFGLGLGDYEPKLEAKMDKLEPSWTNLESTWAILGQLGANLGPTWCQLGANLSYLGPTWSQLGANLGPR